MGHISDKYIFLSEARDTIYHFLKRVGIITFFLYHGLHLVDVILVKIIIGRSDFKKKILVQIKVSEAKEKKKIS